MIFRGATGRDRQALAREPGEGEGRAARVAAALAREPLVHFLVLAGLLFAAYALLEPPGEHRIVIDRAAVDRVVEE